MGCLSSKDSKPKRDISADFEELTEEKKLAFNAPIFMLPEIDISGNNGIKSVFFSKTFDGLVEVTVVFEDEDRPEKWLDPIYDNIRKHLFHRKEDVETFWIQLSETGIPEKLIFKGSWAGPKQSWLEKTPQHLEGEFPASDFQIEEGKVVIWIVTWNHLFGAKNTNPEMKHIEFRNYATYSGTRKQLEDWYKRNN